MVQLINIYGVESQMYPEMSTLMIMGIMQAFNKTKFEKHLK
jgi:hypothetical protein